jgi:hypothetical protein
MLRVRERAYHIWAANGGETDQNWLRAEAEILNNSATQPSEAQPQKKQPGAFKRNRACARLSSLSIRDRRIVIKGRSQGPRDFNSRPAPQKATAATP